MSVRIDRFRIRVMLAALSITALTGCGGAIVGHWYLEEAHPNKQVFSIDNAHFERDGTFTADTTIDGITSKESGTYKFIGYRLYLRPHAGGQRSYTTVLKVNRLDLRDGDRWIVMKKGQRGG